MADADDLAAVRALLAAGDSDGALDRLRGRLRWPGGKQLDDLGSWLAVLGDVVEARGGGELADVTRLAVRDPDSPDRLYDLGYALIDAGAPAIAASVLWHCLALVGDSEEVVCELVSALESALAYGDAFAILEQHAALRTRSFLCEYLYAFNAAMTGNLAATRAALATLRADTPETEQMAATIGAILERAGRLDGISPLDMRDLRGWQFVLTGTLLVHQSPYGFDTPMHGRYAWLRDSHPRLATGIERLLPLARACDVPCVYAVPGRNSSILGHAVATRLALPLVPWPSIGVPAPGLIVAYDLADVGPEENAKLLRRPPGQLFYAHASPWTRDARVAPDVTTVLYETLIPAWGESLIADPTTGAVSREDADLRDAEAIAADIVASAGLSDDETACDDPARWDALVAALWPPPVATRSRWWAGGPVPSNRFD